MQLKRFALFYIINLLKKKNRTKLAQSTNQSFTLGKLRFIYFFNKLYVNYALAQLAQKQIVTSNNVQIR